METLNLPDEKGHFAQYGGLFVAETLMHAITQLKDAYDKYKNDPDFFSRISLRIKAFRRSS